MFWHDADSPRSLANSAYVLILGSPYPALIGLSSSTVLAR